MEIDKKQLLDIANLALIELDPEEIESQRLALERISTYTEKITNLDTSGLQCQTHPFGFDGGISSETTCTGDEGSLNRFRSDDVENKNLLEEWLKAAPDSKGPYIRVPRAVEE